MSLAKLCSCALLYWYRCSTTKYEQVRTVVPENDTGKVIQPVLYRIGPALIS